MTPRTKKGPYLAVTESRPNLSRHYSKMQRETPHKDLPTSQDFVGPTKNFILQKKCTDILKKYITTLLWCAEVTRVDCSAKS